MSLPPTARVPQPRGAWRVLGYVTSAEHRLRHCQEEETRQERVRAAHPMAESCPECGRHFVGLPGVYVHMGKAHPGVRAEESASLRKARWRRFSASPAFHAARLREQAKYPDRIAARKRLRMGVRLGWLLRGPCATCGDAEKTHGHHHRGYTPDAALDVIWLCPQHHRDAHPRALRRTERRMARGTA